MGELFFAPLALARNTAAKRTSQAYLLTGTQASGSEWRFCVLFVMLAGITNMCKTSLLCIHNFFRKSSRGKKGWHHNVRSLATSLGVSAPFRCLSGRWIRGKPMRWLPTVWGNMSPPSSCSREQLRRERRTMCLHSLATWCDIAISICISINGQLALM